MDLILVILAFALMAAGIIGTVIPMLPGPPLSYAGILVLHFSGFGSFSMGFLGLWAGICIVITLLDYVLPSILTKTFGGSRYATVGSFLGLLAGIFIFPPWGLLLGPFLGAWVGELIHNRADGAGAFKVALGAFLAFLLGSGAKLIVCSMLLFFGVRALF